ASFCVAPSRLAKTQDCGGRWNHERQSAWGYRRCPRGGALSHTLAVKPCAAASIRGRTLAPEVCDLRGLSSAVPPHERHHQHGNRKAQRDGEVGVRKSLHLRLPIGHQPEFFERGRLTRNHVAGDVRVMSGYILQPTTKLGIRSIEMLC